MSERTAASLAQIEEFLATLKAQPASTDRESLIEQAEALHRAVGAFHMEAIRFRMHSVERQLKTTSSADVAAKFDAVRHALEAAGFHTRSHSAP
jgi:hypothetical protein